MKRMHRLQAWPTAIALAGLTACGGGERGGEAGALSGTVSIDGSSTVFPISEAMAEEFQIANPGVRVTVGISGTGGGFKKFCGGETDISDASRPIKPSEREQCEAGGIRPLELPVAWDGLTVVVNPANDWVQCMTVEELRRLWQPGSTIRSWNEIRPEWPDRPIILYGAGTDSGTFDYFTEAIVGEEDASREDYTASEDDNVLVVGVEGDPAALGYFGYAYYESNTARLKPVAIDGGDGCVLPTPETVENQTYRPLSRPIFIYVREDALARPEVRAFVEFYLTHARELVPQVGYIPLDPDRYEAILSGLPGEGTDAADAAAAG